MFQFTTTTLINSNKDSNGVTDKFVGTADDLTVARVGKFKEAGIVGGKIFKRAYSAAVLETGNIIVPTGTSGRVMKITIDVRLSMQTDTEYANVNLHFQKPVIAEIISSGDQAADVASLVAAINKYKDRFGFQYVTATDNHGTTAGEILFTCTNPNQMLWEIKLEEESASANSIWQPDYTSLATGVSNKNGAIGFGDDDWMQRQIEVPTRENTRYFGLKKDERPVLGGNYTQYTLPYMIDRDYPMGVVGGGGKSYTTHVFYVKASLITAWEAALTNMDADIIETVS